jgi:hypothetical protein
MADDRIAASDARIDNAHRARTAIDATARTIVVTGDDESSDFWAAALAPRTDRSSGQVAAIAEQGRKGNFLGALQAYERIRGAESGGVAAFDQLVMFVGSGSRLSPLTQSLGNMKAALVLPSGDAASVGLTVGEAAIRSSAPWTEALREGGFEGLVLRWGDEIIIPSAPLTATPGQFADVDAVRFGYSARPTELLATQKEWLLTDERDNVYAELPRQSLDALLSRASRYRAAKSLHVNLGSFAASYQLLDALSEAFGDLLGPDERAANWDPYLWIALHSTGRDEWEESCLAGSTSVPKDFAKLVREVPDFWQRARNARDALSERTGRPFAVKVLDFGDPYWFDAGNHAALRAALSDLFAPGRDGDTIRAFLGLPEGLARGESLIHDSSIAEGAAVTNSIVIGSTIADASSFADRSIVVGSTIGTLRADPGAVVLECDAERLEVDGPAGFAFRVAGRVHVGGDEVTAGISTDGRLIRLSYFDINRVINGPDFETRVGANPLSFAEAAEIVDPLTPPTR